MTGFLTRALASIHPWEESSVKHGSASFSGTRSWLLATSVSAGGTASAGTSAALLHSSVITERNFIEAGINKTRKRSMKKKYIIKDLVSKECNNRQIKSDWRSENENESKEGKECLSCKIRNAY